MTKRFFAATAALFFVRMLQGQQTTPEVKGVPAGFHQNGGVTASGRHYDYKKVAGFEATYLKVLRTRQEIDEYFTRQAAVNRADDDIKELAKAPWYIMKTPWRTDPVTSLPITSMPPNQQQLEELNKAIDDRLILSDNAKLEFKRKLASGDCVVRTNLDPPRFIRMVNGHNVNTKIEIPEDLAKQTKSCEFFLESEPIVINLVFICGNFGFTFTEVWFETTTPPSEEVKIPAKAECVKVEADSAKLLKNGEYKFSMNETLLFKAEVSEDPLIRSQYLWKLDGNPKQGGSLEFTFQPAMVEFQPGRYKVEFSLADQWGRVSTCPAVVVNLTRVVPPPIEVTQNPPPTPNLPPAKEEPPTKTRCGRGCKILILMAVAGAGVAGCAVGGCFGGKKTAEADRCPNGQLSTPKGCSGAVSPASFGGSTKLGIGFRF